MDSPPKSADSGAAVCVCEGKENGPISLFRFTPPSNSSRFRPFQVTPLIFAEYRRYASKVTMALLYFGTIAEPHCARQNLLQINYEGGFESMLCEHPNPKFLSGLYRFGLSERRRRA
jgi:hypothetical protein